MISSLKSKLCEAFEPVSSTYYGWRHFNRCVPDDQRPALAWRKTTIEAMVIQSGLCIGAGLSGLPPQDAQALIDAGTVLLVPALPLAVFMATNLRDFARQEINRRQRLDELRR